MSIFHGEDGFFGQPALAYMENSILKISGSVDVKITKLKKGYVFTPVL